MKDKQESIRQELEIALTNIEKAREDIKKQLELIQDNDESDEVQVHLLINYKLELLDLKLRLNDMLRHLHKINFS